MSKRKGCEFSKRIKEEERLDWHKRNPGNPDAELEVHHIVPISIARELGVPRDRIRSQRNAVAVEKGFHKELHDNEDEETYKVLAQALIGRTFFNNT